MHARHRPALPDKPGNTLHEDQPQYLLWPGKAVQEWRASWIAPPGVARQSNVTFRARTVLHCDVIPPSLPLHITAESVYQLWVNGVAVGCGPVRGTSAVNFYDTYEIVSLLRRGENHLAALVWCMNIPTFKYAPAQPALLVQVDGVGGTTADQEWQVQIAPDWRSDVPKYTFQMGFMEWRDLSREPIGWQTTQDAATAAKWISAENIGTAHTLAAKRLLPRDIPALAVIQHLPKELLKMAAVPPHLDYEDTAIAAYMTDEPHRPLLQRVEEAFVTYFLQPGTDPLQIDPLPNGDGVALTIDFSREICGGFQLEVTASAGTIVDVAYEEALINGRLQAQKPPPANQYAFADRFLLREGRQRIDARYERGFRLLQLTLRRLDQPFLLHGLHGIDRRYPTAAPAEFVCSDSLLTSLWTIGVETLSACATDTFVDCPWREAALWVNDLLVENVTWLQAIGDGRLNARCLRLALSQQRPDGLIPGVCPSDGDDRHILVATNLFLPLILEEYLLYTGDAALVEELLPAIADILDVFAGWEDGNGLVDPPARFWNFVDWSPGLNGLGKEGISPLTLNGFYLLSLEAMARLIARTAAPDTALGLRRRAARTAAGIDRRFWYAGRALYLDTSDETRRGLQLPHALLLLSGTLFSGTIDTQDAKYAACRNALTHPDVIEPELYMGHIVLRALVQANRARAALQRIRQHWGAVVASGSPTLWEAAVHQHGKQAFNGAGSLCHGFSTAPLDFMQGVILGVRPVEPGFTCFTVAPQLCGLKRAEGSVCTPYGRIEIACVQETNAVDVVLNVPPGTRAILSNGIERGPGSHRETLSSSPIENETT